MSKCENCIHYDICVELMAHAKHQEKDFVKECLSKSNGCTDHFKDKSLFVELPRIRYSEINKAWAVDYSYRDCLHTTLCATEESAKAKLKEMG